MQAQARQQSSVEKEGRHDIAPQLRTYCQMMVAEEESAFCKGEALLGLTPQVKAVCLGRYRL